MEGWMEGRAENEIMIKGSGKRCEKRIGRIE